MKLKKHIKKHTNNTSRQSEQSTHEESDRDDFDSKPVEEVPKTLIQLGIELHKNKK